jgi:DNA gyrase/topoisomerase IV subunit B
MAGIFSTIVRISDLEQHFYFEGGIRYFVEHIKMSKKLYIGFLFSDTWNDEETNNEIALVAFI